MARAAQYGQTSDQERVQYNDMNGTRKGTQKGTRKGTRKGIRIATRQMAPRTRGGGAAAASRIPSEAGEALD